MGGKDEDFLNMAKMVCRREGGTLAEGLLVWDVGLPSEIRREFDPALLDHALPSSPDIRTGGSSTEEI